MLEKIDSQHVELMAMKATHAGSYVGAGATTIAGLTLNEVGVLVGMAFTAATYITFLVFKIREDRREERKLQK